MNTKASFICILFLLRGVLCCADSIFVENYSFEDPAGVKCKMWDGEDGTTPDVPGWTDGTIASGDSGLEVWSGTSDGLNRGFLRGSLQDAGDPAVYNVTDHVIVAGESYLLTVDIRNDWNAAIHTLGLYYTSDAGVTLNELILETVDLTSDWAEYTAAYTVSAGDAAIGGNLVILLDNPEYGWSNIDNVRLEVVYTSPIYPENGDMYIGWDDDLSWAVANGWNVNLYWGPENDPNLTSKPEYKRLSDSSLTTWDPGTMEPKTTYYWRVDALEPNALGGYIVHQGNVWSYETAGLAPEAMTISPALGQSVQEGTNAVFEADGVNVETWTWYKQGNPTPLSNGAEYAINANELTVLSVDINDEGFYYCVGSNSTTVETAQTDSSQLVLKRLMGHWKLDYTLDDVTGVYPGSMADPNYTGGIDGGAIDIVTNAAPYRYITVADTNDVYNFYPLGMTVSAWIKTTEAGWGGILSKSTRDPQTGWVMEHNGDSIYMTFRGGGSVNVNGSVADDEWHLVVGTYDPATGITSVYASYVDEYGVNRFAQAQSGVNRNFTFADDHPFRIGIETTTGDTDVNVYIGLIDDVRVYSYAMDITEIAQDLYLPIHGGDVCANPDYDQTFDFTNDCKTNLDDLAVFAGVWLTNGLYTE